MTTPTEVPYAKAQAGLGALMHRLEAYPLDLQLKANGLLVTNPYADGCCDDNPEPSDLITCVRRLDDSGRFWFRHSWGEWIAESDHIIDAAVAIASKLKAHNNT